jgi:hypothetical protein
MNDSMDDRRFTEGEAGFITNSSFHKPPRRDYMTDKANVFISNNFMNNESLLVDNNGTVPILEQPTRTNVLDQSKRDTVQSNINTNNLVYGGATHHQRNFDMSLNFENELTENYHHVQIIDEDVENFKRRLDILLKNFRTDSIKDFMGIKRHLLTEQKNAIGSEKSRSDNIINIKDEQIDRLTYDLNNTTAALNRETSLKERMAIHLYKYKERKYNKDMKTNIFNAFKKFYLKQKKLNDLFNKLRVQAIYNYKLRGFGNLKQNYKEAKMTNVVLLKEKEFQLKLNEMGQYYGKEITELRTRLAEANQSIEKYKESKMILQENLKKALMRGVVAMNFEAMNILDQENLSSIMLQNFNNSGGNMINNMMGNITGATTNNLINEMNNNNNNFGNNNYSNEFKEEKSFSYAPQEKKVITKDSNWINANSVPSRMKSNIISKDKDEFEVDEYDDNQYRRPIDNDPYMNKENSVKYMEPKPKTCYDELTKSI